MISWLFIIIHINVSVMITTWLWINVVISVDVMMTNSLKYVECRVEDEWYEEGE